MIVMKAVKAKRMRIDDVRLELLTAVHTAERELKKEFEKTTATWDHTVEFKTKISLKGGPSVEVTTDDKIYGLVNADTGEYGPSGQKYPIMAKTPGKMLKFQSGYTPKTKVGVIGSTPGGKFGDPTIRDAVMHPGHEGRHFPEQIQKEYTPRFKRLAEKALSKASKKVNRGGA